MNSLLMIIVVVISQSFFYRVVGKESTSQIVDVFKSTHFTEMDYILPEIRGREWPIWVSGGIQISI